MLSDAESRQLYDRYGAAGMLQHGGAGMGRGNAREAWDEFKVGRESVKGRLHAPFERTIKRLAWPSPLHVLAVPLSGSIAGTNTRPLRSSRKNELCLAIGTPRLLAAATQPSKRENKQTKPRE